jgi:hypothetical protein
MSNGLLIAKQNRDGGWPYVRGKSWTEPTVYAVMALLAAGEMDASKRGLNWLLRMQRRDGGWPPQPGIDESSWVTALVALLPRDALGAEIHNRAIDWLLATTGKESSFAYRVREWMLGSAVAPENRFQGWPWVPDAAAWVAPTSLALLALDKERARRPSRSLSDRIESGRQYLFVHMCAGGGWNHGSVRALGYESLPYPETTGMALAAMRGVQSQKVDLSLSVAKRFLADCRSADALNWLRLGLLAHAQLPAGYSPPAEITYRTIPETSLGLLAGAAEQQHDLFWS